jgi:WD40 repeat protein
VNEARRKAVRASLCLCLLAGLGLAPGAAPPLRGPRVTELIEQLGDDDFDKREAASKALEALGDEALAPLRQAASSRADLEVRLRAARAYRKVAARLQLFCYQGHGQPVTGVAFSPDGRLVLSCSLNGGTVRLLDARTGKLLRCMAHPKAYRVACSPDGTKAISGGSLGDQTVRLWDLGNGQELTRFGYREPIVHVVFSADSKKVLCGVGATLRLLDLGTGKELQRFQGHAAAALLDLALSADGKRALSASNDSTVRLWDVATGKELRRLQGHKGVVYGLALSPDGKQAASAGADKLIKLWDLASGKEVRQLEGHTAEVHALSFAPDGRRLASASNDRMIRLWDVGAGRALHTFEGHTGGVYDVAFGPDGRLLVSGGQDKTVRVWRVPR